MVTEAEWKLAGEVEPTVALTPIPEQYPALQAIFDKGLKFVEYADKIQVTDLESEQLAGADLVLVRGYIKDLEKIRRAFKAPLLTREREVDRLFEDITAPFKQADGDYTRKITTYKLELDRARKEAEAINQEVGEAVVDVPDQQKRVRAAVGTVTFIPQADKEKIQAAVDSGVREIPGIHIYPVWTYKVLDIKQVPEQFKRMGTRATR